ncbi:glycosyltransferase [Rhizobium leguminosarum]|uniref:glycosyltransferase n=1 Tax=Rhizobium leguminosarum TaxID=384 RepID=UPI001620A7E9|nr:glycosyltransferase [Rhizobium leguminosarum]MBB4342982.1 glycosyltransferase involved in cell wall biosynthesis [Rhizobium leguminosarum]MBB6296060.1 glycosyltransferase involved in cell wall biosynthesis [Rhizobium leguminosarum]
MKSRTNLFELDAANTNWPELVQMIADQPYPLHQSGLDALPGDASIFGLARRLQESKLAVARLRPKLKIGIVFAVWKETNRLLARTQDNPLGENSLAVKFSALEWLLKDSRIEWSMYVVDDGCPEQSGHVVEQLRRSLSCPERLHVDYLDRVVPGNRPPFHRLKSVNDSKKGGAIALGCLNAIKDNCDYVVYTDCDNSVHLGQLGTLLEVAERETLDAVLGDRQAPTSDFVKHPERRFEDDIARKVVAHIGRLMIPISLPLSDVPSPFKLFTAGFCNELMEELSVFDFAFDYDVVISIAAKDRKTRAVPYTFLDSYESSAWHSIGTYRIWADKLRGIATSVSKNGYAISATMREILLQLDSGEKIQAAMAASLPEAANNLQFGKLGNSSNWSPDEILTWLRKGS